jgi:hypothetical protein
MGQLYRAVAVALNFGVTGSLVPEGVTIQSPGEEQSAVGSTEEWQIAPFVLASV